jgi:hypothetical protein
MAKKNRFRMITLIVTTIVFLTSFCGCENFSVFKDNSQNENAKVIKTETLNDFSTEKDLYQVLLSDGYGKMSLNKDEKYYTTGNGSAKLWVSNDNGKSMIFKQRLKSEVNGFDYTNFKKMKSIRTSIYNESDETVGVIFALEFSDGSKSSIKKYTLQSGWNTLSYGVDREMLSMQFDIEKTMYLTYTFECNETPYTVYVDDISLGLTNSGIKEVVQVIDENEICSFDKNYQMSVFSLYVYSTVRIGYFADFGLTADPERVKSGKSFYVTTQAGMEDKGNWYWIKLAPKYSSLIDWKSLTVNDTISFWVYNDGPSASLAFGVMNTKGKDLQVSLGKTMKANSWTEMTVSVADIKAAADENKYLEEGETIGDIISGIKVGWGPFDDVAQKTFYFDEFKIVKGDAQ